MMIEMIASPFTNLVAPSMEPKKSASLWMLERRSLACCSSISPLFKSASIAICFPGMASSVNLAATSATRSEPFVITINCTSTIIRNMIKPMTTFPRITNCPKVWTTCPAYPLSNRIFLVDEILSPSLNSVVIRRIEGNTENSRVSLIYMVITRISSDSVILSINKKSSIGVGSGIRIRKMIPIIPAVTRILNRFKLTHHSR